MFKHVVGWEERNLPVKDWQTERGISLSGAGACSAGVWLVPCRASINEPTVLGTDIDTFACEHARTMPPRKS